MESAWFYAILYKNKDKSQKQAFIIYIMMLFLAISLVTIKYSPKKGTLNMIMQTTLPYCLVKAETWFLLPVQAQLFCYIHPLNFLLCKIWLRTHLSSLCNHFLTTFWQISLMLCVIIQTLIGPWLTQLTCWDELSRPRSRTTTLSRFWLSLDDRHLPWPCMTSDKEHDMTTGDDQERHILMHIVAELEIWAVISAPQ